MDKKQTAQVIITALAILFIGASVASSKIKTLRTIKAGSITNPYLANNAVNSAKIEDGTVSNQDIANNAITTDKIGSGQVYGEDIADGTITNQDINNTAGISGTKVAPNFGSQNIITAGNGNFGTLTVDDTISNSSPSGSIVFDNPVVVGGGLTLYSSANSSNSATNATTPSEACAASDTGKIFYVDDLDGTGAWIWICEQRAGNTYGWYRVQ